MTCVQSGWIHVNLDLSNGHEAMSIKSWNIYKEKSREMNTIHRETLKMVLIFCTYNMVKFNANFSMNT